MTYPPIIRLFVSSPGGLEGDRAVVRSVVDELNTRAEEESRPRIQILEWPQSIGAASDPYAQGSINDQVSGYDIILTLVWHRLGSPTPRASSGTEEEFDQAIEAVKNGRNVVVLLFFSNIPCSPGDIDPAQLSLVAEFKQRAGRLGLLYHSYNDLADLEERAHVSLLSAIKSICAHRGCPSKSDLHADFETAAPHTTRNLGDRILTNKTYNPQWADYLMVPLVAQPGRNFKLVWCFSTDSPYFRHGFKLSDAKESVLSTGSVQTTGKNLLIHLGRNGKGGNWFFTLYRHGLRIGQNKSIKESKGKSSAACELTLLHDGRIEFRVDERLLHEEFMPVGGTPKVSLMAWGDEHEYLTRLSGLALRAWNDREE